MPVCTRYNIWTCSRWHDRWSHGTSWWGHQSATRQSVVHRSDSRCIDTWCPRGAWLDSVRGNVQAGRSAASIASSFRKCWHSCHAPLGPTAPAFGLWSSESGSEDQPAQNSAGTIEVLLEDGCWYPLHALGTALCPNTPTIKGMSRNYI